MRSPWSTCSFACRPKRCRELVRCPCALPWILSRASVGVVKWAGIRTSGATSSMCCKSTRPQRCSGSSSAGGRRRCTRMFLVAAKRALVLRGGGRRRCGSNAVWAVTVVWPSARSKSRGRASISSRSASQKFARRGWRQRQRGGKPLLIVGKAFEGLAAHSWAAHSLDRPQHIQLGPKS